MSDRRSEILAVNNAFYRAFEKKDIKAIQSIATNVFELLGGKWYLVHHHASPVMG